MARGTWEDFTDKYGFGEGNQLEDRDFDARNILVRLLNEQPEVKAAGIRALAYNRPGVHNVCMVLLAHNIEGMSDEDLTVHCFESTALPEPILPETVDVGELISQAYETLE